MFNIGIFLYKFPNKPFPLIFFILKNLDFNLLHKSQFPIKYSLLFLVIFPLTLLLLVFFYKIDNMFPLYIIIHINSFFKKSLELNNVKNLIKSFLFLISYKINKTQSIPHKLLEIS